jgi:hypothetical protein
MPNVYEQVIYISIVPIITLHKQQVSALSLLSLSIILKSENFLSKFWSMHTLSLLVRACVMSFIPLSGAYIRVLSGLCDELDIRVLIGLLSHGYLIHAACSYC